MADIAPQYWADLAGKQYYLAGPMRGYERFNFDAFFSLENACVSHFIDIVSPARHDVELGLDPNLAPKLPDWFSLEGALKWDLEQICQSNGIILIPGWSTSEGAKKELSVCEWTGGEVWYARQNIDDSWELSDRPYGSDSPKYTPDVAEIKGLIGGETRIIDPVSGAAKGSKLARFDLVPEDVIYELAEHYGKGCAKYAARNWEGGYAYGLSYAAARRHMAAFWSGEDTDEETGSSHLIAAAWHLIALRWFQIHGKGTDDRSR
jgi:Domain of unknown function (DUF5664)/Domain of unknown function (DUF4406)